MAGTLGIEPRLRGSESLVLPLYDIPIRNPEYLLIQVNSWCSSHHLRLSGRTVNSVSMLPSPECLLILG